MKRLATLEPGRHIDRYRVIDVLGEGGMAVVYRVAHDRLGSLHALKVVAVPSRSIMRRLIDEGRAQARIRHRNIVAVHDVIEVDGSPGLVMEYVAGPSLDDLIYGVALPMEQVDALGRGILKGIAAAHAEGFVHRDLKPANVLVASSSEGLTPKIADFGLVKDLQSPSGKTYTGAFMGTPNYVSPEQVRDARGVDHRADLWAAGSVLYELVTGQRAFVGADVLEVFNAVAAARYAPLSEVSPDVPERMKRAIEAALVVDSDRRVGSAEELLDLWAGDVDEASLTPTVRHLDPTLRAQVERLTSSPPSPELMAAKEPGVTLALSEHPPTVADSASRRRRWPAVAITGLSFLVAAFVAIPAFQDGYQPAPAPPLAQPHTPAPPEGPQPKARAQGNRSATESRGIPAPIEAPVPADPPAPVVPVPAPVPDPVPTPSPTRDVPMGEANGTPDPEEIVQPPAPDPLATQALVQVEGDVAVMLVGVEDGSRRFPGHVPPGRYEVMGDFPDEELPVKTATIEVRAGQRLLLRCSMGFKRCRVEEE
ncbi:MAG: serine/threonine protein kinase [Myxococcales bacterium]|nr:serine/threonine protein kinase [Myxococcales bacterium]